MTETTSLTSREEDFYNENEEFLNNRRSLLDDKRDSQKNKRAKDPHWLRCPKCSAQMHEFKLLDIIVEQCEGCNGLFFDNGELETLLNISDRRGFFSSVKRVLYS
ncbi:MAG: acetyl-CoA carboxylase beta subunit [Bacteriovoracaceae bacterium]|jgi:acetyl-CoA carboxylase beta subunit